MGEIGCKVGRYSNMRVYILAAVSRIFLGFSIRSNTNIGFKHSNVKICLDARIFEYPDIRSHPLTQRVPLCLFDRARAVSDAHAPDGSRAMLIARARVRRPDPLL